MKDYSGMSDFEINKLVAISMGLQVQEIDDSKVMGMTSSYHQLKPNTCWVTSGNAPWGQYAPCNDPADAWPIIVENKIDINWTMQRGKVSQSYARNSKPVGGEKHGYIHNNPLRAAMIVFLMMKGTEV